MEARGQRVSAGSPSAATPLRPSALTFAEPPALLSPVPPALNVRGTGGARRPPRRFVHNPRCPPSRLPCRSLTPLPAPSCPPPPPFCPPCYLLTRQSRQAARPWSSPPPSAWKRTGRACRPRAPASALPPRCSVAPGDSAVSERTVHFSLARAAQRPVQEQMPMAPLPSALKPQRMHGLTPRPAAQPAPALPPPCCGRAPRARQAAPHRSPRVRPGRLGPARQAARAAARLTLGPPRDQARRTSCGGARGPGGDCAASCTATRPAAAVQITAVPWH